MMLLPTFTAAPVPNKIYHTDCLSLLRATATASVDLFFADPPYNLGYRYLDYKDNRPDADYLAWCQSWLIEAVRVLKPTGSLFVLNLPKHAIPIGAFLNQHLKFQHWIAWKAASRNSNKPLMPEHYALLYYTKSDVFTVNEVRSRHRRCRNCHELIADYGGKKHLIHSYGPRVSDVWTDIGRSKHKQRGDHPCKLPDRLMRRIIKLASNRGDLIMDPFAGTGTTLEAAQWLGRNFIGSDMSLEYVEMAREALVTPFNLAMFEMEYAS